MHTVTAGDNKLRGAGYANRVGLFVAGDWVTVSGCHCFGMPTLCLFATSSDGGQQNKE